MDFELTFFRLGPASINMLKCIVQCISACFVLMGTKSYIVILIRPKDFFVLVKIEVVFSIEFVLYYKSSRRHDKKG